MEFDESKLENSGWRLALQYYKDFYHLEYPELSDEWKDDAIEFILLNNKDVFSREDVLKENLCTKCGLCCKELQCPYLDITTNLCTIHDNPESKVCSEYPWDDDIGFVLTINCGYQKRFIHQFLNIFFETKIKMGETNGKKN